jgi:hypothetical protein
MALRAMRRCRGSLAGSCIRSANRWLMLVSALVPLAAFAPVHAASGAAVAASPSATWVRPGWPGYAPWAPYRPFGWSAGACLGFGGCAWAAWPEPYVPRRPVAPEPVPPARNALWAYDSSWGYLQRLPPPTPAGNIQPRFREASTVRPEFAEVSQAPAP